VRPGDWDGKRDPGRAFHGGLLKGIVRRRILERGIRPDGRDPVTIGPLRAEGSTLGGRAPKGSGPSSLRGKRRGSKALGTWGVGPKGPVVPKDPSPGETKG